MPGPGLLVLNNAQLLDKRLGLIAAGTRMGRQGELVSMRVQFQLQEAMAS